MYRQILVHEDDRDLQRIVWRDSGDESIQTYCLNTVTYGTASASFLSIKCLDVLAKSAVSEQPEVAHVICTCFYMDDLLTRAEPIESTTELQRGVHNVLASDQFPLRNYISNSSELIDSLDLSLGESLSEHTIDQSEVAFILSIVW